MKITSISYKKNGRDLDLAGLRFGKLTAMYIIGKSKKGNIWMCGCECGGTKEVTAGKLTFGDVKSCGCRWHTKVHKISSKESASHTRMYSIWQAMKTRCKNKNIPAYKNYGGRGILVCKRWVNSFQNFYDDMSEGYSDELSIERIDNNKGYNRDNCRWAKPSEQSRNKRNNYWFEADGKRMIKMDWAKHLGVDYNVINRKLREGYSFEQVYNHFKGRKKNTKKRWII